MNLLQKFKKWFKSYTAPIIILGACVLGIFNWGFIGYKFTAITLFVAIGVCYAIFHIDGFWDKLKSIYKSKI